MELNYKSFGQGEPVLILHGMFGTLDNWQTLAKQLAEEYTVFIVDLRNHGRSPHSEDFSYDLMVEDVVAFMREHWLHHVHLIGHSMGGKVAMRLSSNYPDLVRSLIVVDIAPKAYIGNHQAIFEALFALDLATLDNRQEAENFLAERITENSTRQFILKNLTRNPDTNQFQWRMNLPAIHRAYRHILGQDPLEQDYLGPTLFVKGAMSDYILVEEFADYCLHFPKARLVEIPRAGHWVHAEQPALFLAAVREFLAQLRAS